MPFSNLARLAGMVTLTAMLAGCVDVDMTIEVLTQSTARGTMTATIEKSVYDMMAAQEGQTDFCDGGEIITGDTTVQCINVEEGNFEELLFDADSNEPQPTIVAEAGGRVRVSFPTGSMQQDMGADANDPQTQAMMAAMFEGRFMVLRISGGPIVETNMDKAPDGQSASLTISFVDLMNGSVDLPDVAFAVVQK